MVESTSSGFAPVLPSDSGGVTPFFGEAAAVVLELWANDGVVGMVDDASEGTAAGVLDGVGGGTAFVSSGLGSVGREPVLFLSPWGGDGVEPVLAVVVLRGDGVGALVALSGVDAVGEGPVLALAVLGGDGVGVGVAFFCMGSDAFSLALSWVKVWGLDLGSTVTTGDVGDGGGGEGFVLCWVLSPLFSAGITGGTALSDRKQASSLSPGKRRGEVEPLLGLARLTKGSWSSSSSSSSSSAWLSTMVCRLRRFRRWVLVLFSPFLSLGTSKPVFRLPRGGSLAFLSSMSSSEESLTMVWRLRRFRRFLVGPLSFSS